MTVTANGRIAFRANDAIFGIGGTDEEAIADASKYTTDASKMKVLPATEALINTVDLLGGDITFVVSDGGIACLPTEINGKK